MQASCEFSNDMRTMVVYSSEALPLLQLGGASTTAARRRFHYCSSEALPLLQLGGASTTAARRRFHYCSSEVLPLLQLGGASTTAAWLPGEYLFVDMLRPQHSSFNAWTACARAESARKLHAHVNSLYMYVAGEDTRRHTGSPSSILRTILSYSPVECSSCAEPDDAPQN
jgi:hypothetical protein